MPESGRALTRGRSGFDTLIPGVDGDIDARRWFVADAGCGVAHTEDMCIGFVEEGNRFSLLIPIKGVYPKNARELKDDHGKLATIMENAIQYLFSGYFTVLKYILAFVYSNNKICVLILQKKIIKIANIMAEINNLTPNYNNNFFVTFLFSFVQEPCRFL